MNIDYFQNLLKTCYSFETYLNSCMFMGFLCTKELVRLSRSSKYLISKSCVGQPDSNIWGFFENGDTLMYLSKWL